MKGIRILLACIRKADQAFNLIEKDDKIVIGISGGKDSMALFYALHLYKKFSKNNFELYPCMIDLGFDSFDATKIKNWFTELGYELAVLPEHQVYQILKVQKEKQGMEKLPCSICSRMKKAIINKYAKSIGVTKVSFAHHKDDAIETLFLNEIYGGRIATFSPKMLLSNEGITFIRPFIYASEKDIKKTVKEENIPISGSGCPNDKKTKREDIKELINNIYKQYPTAEDNFLTMLDNPTKEDVFYMHEEHRIENTPYYYVLVRNVNQYIDYKKFTKSKVSELEKNLSLFLVYKNEVIVASAAIEKTDKREFTLRDIKGQVKAKKEFLEDIKKELYARYNPYIFIE